MERQLPTLERPLTRGMAVEVVNPTTGHGHRGTVLTASRTRPICTVFTDDGARTFVTTTGRPAGINTGANIQCYLLTELRHSDPRTRAAAGHIPAAHLR